MRESLRLRDWEKAQARVRDWEIDGLPVKSVVEQTSIESACNAFLQDAEARKLEESTLKKYRVLFTQMRSFTATHGLPFVKQWEEVAVVRKFRAGWADGGISAKKKLERLRAFFRFARDSKWIEDNPAAKLKEPKVTDPPTLPFTQAEMKAILEACRHYPDNYGRTNQDNAQILRALVLLLRYSGLRIGDAATCAKDRLTGDRLFLYTQKTGVPVMVKLPPFVVEELNALSSVSETYFFWTGEGKANTVAGNYRRSLRKLFGLAGIKGGHPHRFRDTFAVELLLAGTPVKDVSTLLGHSSVEITEKHYGPWVRERQEQMEQNVERSWARDSIVQQEMGSGRVSKVLKFRERR